MFERWNKLYDGLSEWQRLTIGAVVVAFALLFSVGVVVWVVIGVVQYFLSV